MAAAAYINTRYPEIKVVNIALPDAYVEHGKCIAALIRPGLQRFD